MKIIRLCLILIAAFPALALSADELPREAVCVVCKVREGTTKPEKVVASSDYEGKPYYFCSKPCKEAFDKDPASYLPPALPRPAPNFTATDLKGVTVSLEDYRGRVLLLDFWATWCKPCVKTIPGLQKLHEQRAGKDFTVLGVSIDEKGEKKVKAFVAKHGITYPVLLDAGDAPAYQTYGVRVIPAMFLIDQKGQIVRQWIGEADQTEVEATVAGLLGESAKKSD